MKMRYVTRIQANLKRYEKLISKHTTSRMVDGSYRSIYKGRSMNFDELREYVSGDNIKDMDWKASARSRKLLVRQYVAEKKHNIMFVFDTNKSMNADSELLEDKKELAIMSAGTLAYMVDREGDYVGSLYATDSSINYMPFKSGLGNIELILEYYEKEVSKQVNTDINDVLDYIIRNFRARMIVVIVTDQRGLGNITESNLKRLLVANDVLVLNISDANMAKGDMYDMEGCGYLPDFFTSDKRLVRSVREKKTSVYNECMAKLKKYGIACATIDSMDELDIEMMNLLTRQRKEKKL